MDRYTSRGRELMKEIKDTTKRELPNFNRRALMITIAQMMKLHHENTKDVATMNSGSGSRALVPAVHFRHAILERNIRIVLTYLYVRMGKLRRARWNYGATLPDFIHNNATEQEVQYFQNYSKVLSNYMRSIGDFDLTVDWKPFKTEMVQVHILKDWELMLDDGDFIKMVAGSIHLIPVKHYEHLFRMGVAEIHKPKIPETCTKY